MPLVTRCLLLVAALSQIVTSTIVGADEKTTDSRNNTYFSRNEVSKYFREAQEAKEAAPRESHLRAEVEGPIVDLAPMTVQTDDSPLLRKIRQRIELGPESVQRRLAELSPMLARDAAYDARAADRFFTEDANIGPTDAPAPARVDFVPILKSAGKTMRELGNE